MAPPSQVEEPPGIPGRFSVTWDDLDEKRGLIRVRRSRVNGNVGPTKANTARSVPLHPTVKDLLDEHREWLSQRLPGHPLVFPPRAGTYRSSGALNNPLKRAAERGGVEKDVEAPHHAADVQQPRGLSRRRDRDARDNGPRDAGDNEALQRRHRRREALGAQGTARCPQERARCGSTEIPRESQHPAAPGQRKTSVTAWICMARPERFANVPPSDSRR